MWLFGTGQIFVREWYGYKLRGSGFENTDNGAAEKKEYVQYVTTHLLPVNNNLLLHLIWSKLQYQCNEALIQ